MKVSMYYGKKTNEMLNDEFDCNFGAELNKLAGDVYSGLDWCCLDNRSPIKDIIARVSRGDYIVSDAPCFKALKSDELARKLLLHVYIHAAIRKVQSEDYQDC